MATRHELFTAIVEYVDASIASLKEELLTSTVSFDAKDAVELANAKLYNAISKLDLEEV